MSFTSILDAREAVRLFHFEKASDLTEAMSEQLATAVGQASPVDTMMQAIEVLLSGLEDLDTRGAELGRDLSALAAEYGFHGFAGEKGLEAVRAFNERLSALLL